MCGVGGGVASKVAPAQSGRAVPSFNLLSQAGPLASKRGKEELQTAPLPLPLDSQPVALVIRTQPGLKTYSSTGRE